MRSQITLVLVVASILSTRATSAATDDTTKKAGLEFFEKRIRPVLVEHCYACHSEGKKRQGGLLLDTRAGIRRGGDSGPAVVPSKPGESLLLSALRHEDGLEMPPKGKLPAQTIRNFKRWIQIGAPDPRDGGTAAAADGGGVSIEEGRKFWSFQPIARPQLPAPSIEDWPRSPIDHFTLAEMTKRELTPTADAAPDVLIRRLYFDLIGLPPTPKQIDQFLDSCSKDRNAAVEAVVDQLLASTRFGERWGRHWLDVVRFSESSGGGRTRIFDHAWRYRDYVIDAFNRDKPFDRFLTEQLAGDLLPVESADTGRLQLTATSFLAIGPINYELQDKELLDMEVVDEQLTTMGKAFLGMTIGCARCHDHKFDPIPTRDYYALAGIFRSTKSLNHANVSNPVMRSLPENDEQKKRRAAFEASAKPLQQQVASLQAALKKLDGDRNALKRVSHELLAGIVLDETKAKLDGGWKSSTSIPGFVETSYHYAGAGSAKAHYAVKLPRPGAWEVRLSYTPSSNRATNVPVTIWHAGGETKRKVSHRSQPRVEGHFISLGIFNFESEARVTIGCENVNGVVIADAVQWLPAANGKAGSSFVGRDGNAATESEKNATKKQRDTIARQLAQAQQKLKALQNEAPPATPVVMSVEEGNIADCHIAIRGNVHNEGALIPRGFLSVLTNESAAGIDAKDSGRLELARWMTGPENTLTRRVFVNRVWYWIFGAGLVRSVDNFGATGEQPSHPQLLDWLASDFADQGWSVKTLIKRIVLSRTYQLASTRLPEALKLDPENRLLSYAPRKRLDAEAIRDAILATSGQLDLSTGGSTIRPGSKTEFNYQFGDTTLDGRRRSVYVPVFRNTLLDVFEVFDFADPNLVMGRRAVSTLPTQGLFLMNSPWVMQQSEKTAETLLSDGDLSDDERIERAYRLLFGRVPAPAERQLAERYLEQAKSDDQRRAAWSQLIQALYASVDFRFLR